MFHLVNFSKVSLLVQSLYFYHYFINSFCSLPVIASRSSQHTLIFAALLLLQKCPPNSRSSPSTNSTSHSKRFWNPKPKKPRNTPTSGREVPSTPGRLSVLSASTSPTPIASDEPWQADNGLSSLPSHSSQHLHKKHGKTRIIIIIMIPKKKSSSCHSQDSHSFLNINLYL